MSSGGVRTRFCRLSLSNFYPPAHGRMAGLEIFGWTWRRWSRTSTMQSRPSSMRSILSCHSSTFCEFSLSGATERKLRLDLIALGLASSARHVVTCQRLFLEPGSCGWPIACSSSLSVVPQISNSSSCSAKPFPALPAILPNLSERYNSNFAKPAANLQQSSACFRPHSPSFPSQVQDRGYFPVLTMPVVPRIYL